MGLTDCKRLHGNLGMVLVQVYENTMKFIKWSMKYWNTPLTAGRKLLA